jgi:Zn-dependent protease
MIAAITSEGAKIAGYLLVSLFVGMTVREYARAFVTAKLGDPTPRLWGRLTLDPRQWFDAFGSVILPVLIAVLWAAGVYPPPFAYAKPAALDPNYLRRHERDVILASLAGPVANLLVALIPAALLRLPITGEAALVALLFMTANVSLAVFHLMPIPGLDGARILAKFLPPRARAVYVNLDQYLVLFILVVFFLFAGPLTSIVNGLTDGVCSLISGMNCPP